MRNSRALHPISPVNFIPSRRTHRWWPNPALLVAWCKFYPSSTKFLSNIFSSVWDLLGIECAQQQSNRHSLARESGSWVGRGCGHMVQCEWRRVVANLYKFVTSNDLFLLNRELDLKSVWIIIFFEINGTKQDPICCIFYLKFLHYDVLSQHFWIGHFNISSILV